MEQPHLGDLSQFRSGKPVKPIAVNADRYFIRTAFLLHSEVIIDNVPNHAVGYALASPEEGDI